MDHQHQVNMKVCDIIQESRTKNNYMQCSCRYGYMDMTTITKKKVCRALKMLLFGVIVQEIGYIYGPKT